MNKYLCPYCHIQLNVDNHVILVGYGTSGHKGLILLNENLGDYNVKMPFGFSFDKGEKIHFHCPGCSKSLDYSSKEDFAWILKHDEEGREFTIIFSVIFGNQATYKISEERTISYGEKAIQYTNPEWYLHKE
jgi:heterodisulfide reductase subunit B